MRTLQEIETAFAPTEALADFETFFMVGIGGAGMSALAHMLLKRGKRVIGTDSTDSQVVHGLRDAGAKVSLGHSGEHVPPGVAMILSDAIPLDGSPEVDAARSQNLLLFRRSQLLAYLVRGKKVIAVTGTHGKTTVTGMIGAALRAAGVDPLIVVGANVADFGGSVVEGQGPYAVVEACEAYNGFLDLHPFISVLTNLELDHVDFHGSYNALRKRVVDFADQTSDALLYCESDTGAAEVAQESHKTSIAYAAYDGDIALPGEHNKKNAGAAIAVAMRLGLNIGAARKGVEEFHGAERRLQLLLDGEIKVYDDYAHHPTEIEASLQALREPGRRLVVVFQPHLYSRTAAALPQFSKALSLADVVVITDIYPAREAPIPGISSSRVAEQIKKPVRYVPSRRLLVHEVLKLVQPGDTVVGMGAGNIDQFAPAFVDVLREKSRPERRTKVVVLRGGDSAEREVSLLSGQAMFDALVAKGYDASMLDVSEALLGAGALNDLTGVNRPDAVLLAVHGTNAEDGAIQGLLELLHLPYTGSGIQASALAMDKDLTKTILKAQGIAVPEGVVVTREDQQVDLPLPLVVKPNAQGSTVGLSFVERKEGLKPALRHALDYGSPALVEEWVKGMEISVPVLGGKALPPVEIAPANGRYDFESKYTPGATEEIVPARLPKAVLEEAQRLAEKAHIALRCEGATRTDFIVRNGTEPVVLEVNTLPGMTATSLLPNSAKAAGISFEDVVDWMVRDCLERYAEKA